ncbi:hypothetical protein TTMY_1619 [Thermus thermophilus]|nr:hypothetical protein TTMY_1619 [Thermus thermophilus]
MVAEKPFRLHRLPQEGKLGGAGEKGPWGKLIAEKAEGVFRGFLQGAEGGLGEDLGPHLPGEEGEPFRPQGLPFQPEAGPGGEGGSVQGVENLPGKPRVEVAERRLPLPPVAEEHGASLEDPFRLLYPQKAQGAGEDAAELLPGQVDPGHGGEVHGLLDLGEAGVDRHLLGHGGKAQGKEGEAFSHTPSLRAIAATSSLLKGPPWPR